MAKCSTFPLALAGLIVVGAFGMFRLEAQRDQAETAAEVAQVAEETRYTGLTQEERRELRRRIENTVRERGVIESASKSTVSSRFPGSTTILNLMPEGVRAKKGEVVVELDGSVLEEKLKIEKIQLAKAEAELKQAKAALASQRRQSNVTTAAISKAVEVAKLSRAKWKHEYALQMETVQGELRVAEARMKAAQTQLHAGGKNVAEARVAVAEADAARRIGSAKLKLLSESEKDFQTAQRELEVLMREAEMLKISQESQAEIAAATASVREAEAALNTAQRQCDRLARQLADCKLRAPRDGNVVYSHQRSRRAGPVTIELGASVRERQPIVHVVDFRRLQFRVRVHESRINRVKSGQPVVLRVDALGDQTIPGTVRAVSNTPEPGEWPNNDVKYFTVIVSIDGPVKSLKPGMSCEAEIDVSKSK